MTKPLTAKQRNNRRAMARIAARLRAANIAEVESLMTPKQRVVAKYPEAYCGAYEFACCVYEKPAKAVSRGRTVFVNLLGTGRTRRQAWSTAAANLRKGK